MDKNLMNFYWVVQNRTEDIINYIEQNRPNLILEQVKQFRYELDNEQNEIVRAFKYYTCIYTGYSGKPYSTPTQSNLDRFYNRNYIKDFELINSTLSKCELSSTDYHNLIYTDCLYYCDPPYYKVSGDTYYGLKGKNHKEFNHIEFHDFICKIAKNNKVIISYEDSQPIRELYKDWNKIIIDKKSVYYNTKKGIGESKQTNELLIMNY